ncbi:MAG: DDE-type integrase/transposase/recombinase [Deltaproteobacteria bacterium]|nr:DDE-type integrase/transposase/recombinase [Deltaproteobacteria bacterium]
MAKSKGRGRRRRYGKYTAKQRGVVVEDAVTLGVSGAADKHGIPASTVSRWKVKAEAKAGEATRGRATWRIRAPAKAAVAASPEEPELDADGVPTIFVKGARSKTGNRPARRYTPSEKADILEYMGHEGVTAASKHYGVSRYSIYDWKRKVERAAAGKGRSPTSGPTPTEIEGQRDREILGEWHQHPGLGPSQIRNQLRRKGVKVGVQTVRRVMEDSGYRPAKVKSQPHDERFEAVRPNHIWHLDYLHRHINRASTNTLIVLDDCSRFVVGHGVDDAERANLVINTFEEAVERHGKPETVLHDKGAAFWSWRGISRFTTLLTEMGVDQITAEHKEWNGKLEVFNANLSKELFDVHRFYDVAEMRRRLAAHLHWYNHGRTSHALGGLLAPADRYYGRAEEVLARIEAGAGRDGLDAIDLRDRCLDLFKVVSQGGVPEVWLMGQKVLELRP